MDAYHWFKPCKSAERRKQSWLGSKERTFPFTHTHTHVHPPTHSAFLMATRVYIGRLARDARERDLERLFKGYGDIREINIKNGYGFVEFKDPRDAEDVVYDFHGKDFLGERYAASHIDTMNMYIDIAAF